MNVKRLIRYAGCALLVIVIALGSHLYLGSPPSARAQQQATITVGTVEAPKDSIAAVKVSVTGVPSPGLSDFEGRLSYDPAVANVREIKGLNGYNIAAFQIDNSNGVARFIGFKISGTLITGGEFLQFDMFAAGDPGESTTLQLSFRTFNTTQGAISHVVQHGQFKVVAKQQLEANFTFSPAQPRAGQEVQFTDTSSGGGTITSWSWDFGDGATSTRQNPKHTYSQARTYQVKLTVEDDQGNSDSVTKQIVVGGALTFPIHNFPNPASTETTFVYDLPEGTTSARLWVYDLVGRLVFTDELGAQSDQYEWDLRDQNDQAVPDGAYYYRAAATTPGGTALSNVGKLVIRR